MVKTGAWLSERVPGPAETTPPTAAGHSSNPPAGPANRPDSKTTPGARPQVMRAIRDNARAGRSELAVRFQQQFADIARRAAPAAGSSRLPMGMCVLDEGIGILHRDRQTHPGHDRQIDQVVADISDPGSCSSEAELRARTLSNAAQLVLYAQIGVADAEIAHAPLHRQR
jgi:hypothetical protein